MVGDAGGGLTVTSRPARPLEWMQQLPAPSSDLPHKQCLVLHRLALAMGRDGTGWVTLERLADEAEVGYSTAQRAAEWAMANGWLDRTARGHRITADRRAASTYRLTLPSGPSSRANRSANDRLAQPCGADPTGQTSDPTGQNGQANRSANDLLRAPFQEPPTQQVPPPSSAGRTAQSAAPPSTNLDRLDALLEALSADDVEYDLAYGMASNSGSHPQAIVNAILARRTEDAQAEAEFAAARRQSKPPTTGNGSDPWTAPLPDADEAPW